MNDNSKIVADGVDNFKRSKTYRDNVTQITRKIEAEYNPLLNRETNILKWLILKIKMERKLRREISKLTSLYKLFTNTDT
jgi:hypothetical protein